MQERLRAEINAALTDRSKLCEETGYLSYETISALPWLDAILKETLRL